MMKKRILATALLTVFSGLTLAAPPYGAAAGVPQVEDLTGQVVPEARGIHWTRDVAPVVEAARNQAQQSRARNPNMTYHNGKVMPTAVTTAIFWGTSWGTYSGDKITGIDAWYTGYSNSKYSGTVTEYTGTGSPIGKATTYQGHIIDTTASTGGGNTGTILGEVCKAINNHPDASGNGYYPVYTDTPRGNASYCAWHASGTCPGNSTALQFAYFFKLDGDAGCDPQDTSGKHSQGLAALANVTAHELSETRTDPSTTTATGPGAWYDSAGAENGDKCGWTFGVPLVTFSDGTQWKLQGEWSNAAYTLGTGYPNSSGQKGCLSGL